MGEWRCFSGSCSILGQAGGRPSKDKRATARFVNSGGPSSSHDPNFSREAALLRSGCIGQKRGIRLCNRTSGNAGIACQEARNHGGFFAAGYNP